MKNLSFILIRQKFFQYQTLGSLRVISSDNKILFECKTLELPFHNNKKNVSCIPTSTYPIYPRYTKKRGHHFILGKIYPRELILIHSGNYYTDIRGCILVGTDYQDINKDSIQDIINSRNTLKKLTELVNTPTTITIINEN